MANFKSVSRVWHIVRRSSTLYVYRQGAEGVIEMHMFVYKVERGFLFDVSTQSNIFWKSLQKPPRSFSYLKEDMECLLIFLFYYSVVNLNYRQRFTRYLLLHYEKHPGQLAMGFLFVCLFVYICLLHVIFLLDYNYYFIFWYFAAFS